MRINAIPWRFLAGLGLLGGALLAVRCAERPIVDDPASRVPGCLGGVLDSAGMCHYPEMQKFQDSTQ